MDRNDLSRRKPAHLRVLPDNVFAAGEVNAEQFVVCNVALNPLDIGTKLPQDLV